MSGDNHGRLVLRPVSDIEVQSWKWEEIAGHGQFNADTPEPTDIRGGRRITIVAEDGTSMEGLILDSAVIDAKGGDVLRLVIQMDE